MRRGKERLVSCISTAVDAFFPPTTTPPTVDSVPQRFEEPIPWCDLFCGWSLSITRSSVTSITGFNTNTAASILENRLFSSLPHSLSLSLMLTHHAHAPPHTHTHTPQHHHHHHLPPPLSPPSPPHPFIPLTSSFVSGLLSLSSLNWLQAILGFYIYGILSHW